MTFVKQKKNSNTVDIFNNMLDTKKIPKTI